MMFAVFVTLILVGLSALVVAVIIGLLRNNSLRRVTRFSLGSLFFLTTAIVIALAFSRSAFFDHNAALAFIGFPYLVFFFC